LLFINFVRERGDDDGEKRKGRKSNLN